MIKSLVISTSYLGHRHGYKGEEVFFLSDRDLNETNPDQLTTVLLLYCWAHDKICREEAFYWLATKMNLG